MSATLAIVASPLVTAIVIGRSTPGRALAGTAGSKAHATVAGTAFKRRWYA
jgi:hypothetical protein